MLVACLLAGQGIARANDIYLSPGTPDNIQAAVYSASAGDTIHLSDGVYTITQGIYVGVPNLTITSDNGGAILDGSGNVATDFRQYSALQINGNGDKVLNLQIRNSISQGITVYNASDVLVQYCSVYGCRGTGIAVNSNEVDLSSTNEPTGDVIDNCYVSYNSTDNAGLNQGAWGTGITVTHVHNSQVSNCDVHDNFGEGIGYFAIDGGYVYNNRSHNNFSANIYLDNASRVNVDSNACYSDDDTHNRFGYPANGILMAVENNAAYGGVNYLYQNTIQNNRIYGAGYGIWYGNYQNGGGLGNSTIHDNYVWGSYIAAAGSEGDTVDHQNTSVYNNTFVSAGRTNATYFNGTGWNIGSNTYTDY